MCIRDICIDVVLELGRAVNILCVNFLRATGDAVYPVSYTHLDVYKRQA